MTAISERMYVRTAKAISEQIDIDRWQLAELAREGREAGIPAWDEIIGKLPRVRRAARTIRDWARAADVRQLCNRPYEVDFSCYVRASRYLDSVLLTDIEEVFAQAERDHNSVDEVSALLDNISRPMREAREALLNISASLRDALDKPLLEPVYPPLSAALKALDEAVAMFSEKANV